MEPGTAAVAIAGMIVGGIILLGFIILLIVWMGLSHTRKMQQIKSGKELAKALEEQRVLREEINELRDRLNQQILNDEREVQKRLNA